MAQDILTEKDTLFCELYVNGSAPYAGNAIKCYTEVFAVKSRNIGHLAAQMVARPEIKTYLEDLHAMSCEEAKSMKAFLTANLKQIVQETSTAEYMDRRGTILSPAALRSVAVSASKALMDMYPVKEVQVNKLNIGSEDGAGITFNVIMPEASSVQIPPKTASDN